MVSQNVRRKFRIHYILIEPFWLNISWVILKSVRRELTFWLSVFIFLLIGAGR